MTFNELWRRSLRRKSDHECSIDTPQGADVLNGEAVNSSPFSDPDQAEINRYLDWLEKSLLSGEAGEHSVR
jgi:hypothetical protein